MAKGAPNGSRYNAEFGGKQYMIQMNWSPETQSCVQAPAEK